MTLQEFEKKLNEIRARNGWIIKLSCVGLWIVEIYDKETKKLLAKTGATGLNGLTDIFEIPLNKPPWI